MHEPGEGRHLPQAEGKNGAYILVLNDDGIGLKGPGGAMVIDPFELTTVTAKKAS